MSAILHLLSRSARQGDGWQQCLLHVAAGDALVLLEEAVVEALAGGKEIEQLDNLSIAVFVLQTELQLRGLGESKLAAGVTAIDYGALVDLVVKFELSQTWS